MLPQDMRQDTLMVRAKMLQARNISEPGGIYNVDIHNVMESPLREYKCHPAHQFVDKIPSTRLIPSQRSSDADIPVVTAGSRECLQNFTYVLLALALIQYRDG